MTTYRSPFTQLRQQLRKQREFLQGVLTDATQIAKANLRENTPGKKLPDEWVSTVQVSGRQGQGRVYNTRVERDPNTWEPIMGYLNFGTRTHWIEPVNAQALHWEEFGQHYFSKGHIVSGILGSFFMEGTQKQIETFEKTLQKRWEAFLHDQ
jgi:hypothetical protein